MNCSVLPLSSVDRVAMSGAAVNSQRLIECNMADIWGEAVVSVGQCTPSEH